MEGCNQLRICDEKFINIHKRIDDIKDETIKINDITNVLVELQTIIKQQQSSTDILFSQLKEDSDKRDILIEKLIQNIGELNTNQIKMGVSLDTLASKLKITDTNVYNLNKKVDKINQDHTDNSSIKVNDIVKNILLVTLSSGVTFFVVKALGG